MSNNNMTTTFIRLAFAKGSDNIRVGLTKLGNKTLTGEIMASDDLIVNHQMTLTSLSGEGAVGKVGTICITEDEWADELIEHIDSIQASRPVNARGNKFPFIYLEVITEGNIIFNRGLNGGSDLLTFLDVGYVEVHENAPAEVVQIEKPVVVSSRADARAASNYGTVDYRQVRKLRQAEAARASLEIESVKQTSGEQTNETRLQDEQKGEVSISVDERETLLLGGFTSDEIKELSRERVDRLVAALSGVKTH